MIFFIGFIAETTFKYTMTYTYLSLISLLRQAYKTTMVYAYISLTSLLGQDIKAMIYTYISLTPLLGHDIKNYDIYLYLIDFITGTTFTYTMKSYMKTIIN